MGVSSEKTNAYQNKYAPNLGICARRGRGRTRYNGVYISPIPVKFWAVGIDAHGSYSSSLYLRLLARQPFIPIEYWTIYVVCIKNAAGNKKISKLHVMVSMTLNANKGHHTCQNSFKCYLPYLCRSKCGISEIKEKHGIERNNTSDVSDQRVFCPQQINRANGIFLAMPRCTPILISKHINAHVLALAVI